MMKKNTVAKILKKRREELGFSLEFVSEKLKIKVSHLASLESNNSDNSETYIYTIGFLKSYAKFLGINCEDIVIAYNGGKVVNDERQIELNMPKAVREDTNPSIYFLIGAFIGFFIINYIDYNFLNAKKSYNLNFVKNNTMSITYK